VIAFILRRILYIIPVLLGVLLITLTLFFVVADDPVLQYASQNPSEAELRALRREFELDRPAFVSFTSYWLDGEDILESKAREVFEEMVRQVGGRADELLAQRDDATRAQMEQAWRALQHRYRRGVRILHAQDDINEDVAELMGDAAPQVEFSGLALTEEEKELIAKRSPWDAQFFRVLRFDFAESMQEKQSIWKLIRDKAPRTLAITIPMFLIGLAIELTLSLIAASRRGRPIDTGITVMAVLAMSIPFLSYIIFGQWIAAETRIVPVSGWAPLPEGIRYIVFPVAIGVIAGLGAAIRFYRAVLIEEMDKDYVRTARAKGVKRSDVLYIHVLRNAGIPIVTRLSVIVPFLITGSLLIETTFEIPGLGDLMLSAITARDFWVVMPLTYLLAVVYSVVVLLTDVVYAFIDPRVRVGG